MAKKYYSQRTKGYEKIKLGHGPTDLYHYGCYVVALTNLSPLGLTPPEVNTLLLKGGCFKDDLIINPERVAKLLNLEYNGVDYNVSKPPKYRTIAKVDMSPAVGVQSHFVVIKPDKSIVDSWTGDIRPKGTYPVTNYRLFKRLPDVEETIPTQEDTTPMQEPIGETGIDLSHWNSVTNWDKLKKYFIIHKCTQGTGYLDSTYEERKDKIMGSYHYADGGDPIKEANWFIKNSDENMLVLDWEIEHNNPVDWCSKFIAQVKKKTGKECWLYTNDARAIKYDFPKDWKFWIARYGVNDGTKSMEPKFKDWDIWQYTSRGDIAGVAGFVDMNYVKENIQEEPEQVWLINKKNNMDLLKRLYDNKVLKMAGWNALGAFLSVLAIYLGDLSPQYSIILVPVILSITKYLNTKK